MMDLWKTRLLNLVSALALLAAASWFSYNMFQTRDLNYHIRNVISTQEGLLPR